MSLLRRCICIILCAAVMACLCACSGEETQRQITLSVMTVLGDDDILPIYSEALTEFTAENKNLTVRDTTVRSSDAYKLGLYEQETYNGADSPDVVCASRDMLGDAALLENFISVNEVRVNYPEYAKQTIASVFSSVRADDGFAYSVPLYAEYECIVANSRLLAEYGSAEVMTEFPLFVQTLDKLAGDGILPVANKPEESTALIESLVLTIGGEQALSKGLERDELTISDVWQRAFDLYGSICASPVSDSDVTVDPVEIFTSGGAALLICDGRTAAELSGNDDYDIFSVPSGGIESVAEKCVIADFSVGFYITEKAYSDPERLAAAIQYIEYMTGSAVGGKLSQCGLLSSNANAYDEDDNSLCAQMQRIAGAADYFVGGKAEQDRAFCVDLEKRLEEVAGGLSGAQAAQLMLVPGSSINDITVEAGAPANTDINNVQTP